MTTPTLRERMARMEEKLDFQTTLLTNHIAHHEKRDQWLLRILGTLVAGVILMALPGCIRMLYGVV